jgi:hypothetical protein
MHDLSLVAYLSIGLINISTCVGELFIFISINNKTLHCVQ